MPRAAAGSPREICRPTGLEPQGRFQKTLALKFFEIHIFMYVVKFTHRQTAESPAPLGAAGCPPTQEGCTVPKLLRRLAVEDSGVELVEWTLVVLLFALATGAAFAALEGTVGSEIDRGANFFADYPDRGVAR